MTRDEAVDKIAKWVSVVDNGFSTSLEESADLDRERHEVIAVVKGPRWTTDKPTVPGFYWNRFDPRYTVNRSASFGTHIVFVSIVDRKIRFIGTDAEEDLDVFSGEWAGPIEPPQ